MYSRPGASWNLCVCTSLSLPLSAIHPRSGGGGATPTLPPSLLLSTHNNTKQQQQHENKKEIFLLWRWFYFTFFFPQEIYFEPIHHHLISVGIFLNVFIFSPYGGLLQLLIVFPRKKYIEIHITRAKKGGERKKAVERERSISNVIWFPAVDFYYWAAAGLYIYFFFSLLLLFSSLEKRVEFNLVNIPSWNKLMVIGLSCVCVCADGPIDCS